MTLSGASQRHHYGECLGSLYLHWAGQRSLHGHAQQGRLQFHAAKFGGDDQRCEPNRELHRGGANLDDIGDHQPHGRRERRDGDAERCEQRHHDGECLGSLYLHWTGQRSLYRDAEQRRLQFHASELGGDDQRCEPDRELYRSGANLEYLRDHQSNGGRERSDGDPERCNQRHYDGECFGSVHLHWAGQRSLYGDAEQRRLQFHAAELGGDGQRCEPDGELYSCGANLERLRDDQSYGGRERSDGDA